MNFKIKEIKKFIGWGFVATIIAYVFLIILNACGVHYLVAISLAQLCNILLSFRFHKFKTFEDKNKKIFSQMVVYTLCMGTLFLGNVGLVAWLIEIYKIQHEKTDIVYAQIIGSVPFIPARYVVAKYIFPESP